jgi:hypothetical protein
MCNSGVAHCRQEGTATVTVTDRIEREIVVAAPADRLWEVLTRPEHIGRWFEGMDVEMDLRPGGAPPPVTPPPPAGGRQSSSGP